MHRQSNAIVRPMTQPTTRPISPAPAGMTTDSLARSGGRPATRVPLATKLAGAIVAVAAAFAAGLYGGAALPAAAAGPTAASRVIEAPVPQAVLSAITGAEAFRAATEVLEADGYRVDLGSATMLSVAGQPGYEVRVTATACRGCRLKFLLVKPSFVSAAEPPIVYFVEPEPERKVPGPQGAKGAEALGWFGCGSWSSWQMVGSTYCGTSIVCPFSAGFQATFADFTRSRQCRNGIQVQTKKVRIHCGC